MKARSRTGLLISSRRWRTCAAVLHDRGFAVSKTTGGKRWVPPAPFCTPVPNFLSAKNVLAPGFQSRRNDGGVPQAPFCTPTRGKQKTRSLVPAMCFNKSYGFRSVSSNTNGRIRGLCLDFYSKYGGTNYRGKRQEARPFISIACEAGKYRVCRQANIST